MLKIFRKKDTLGKHKPIIDNENLILGSTLSVKTPMINGLDLYFLLHLLSNTKITIIELSENTQTLYKGNAKNYNCERAKYEVIQFEKVYYDNSYMITVKSLIS